MTSYIPEPQVTVLDTGGQYCHLIARKVRELGVYAEVRPSETPANTLKRRKAIIISGGPNSVYEAGSPTVDAAIFSLGTPVLGICYGQQLMAHLLGGQVRKGDKGEYGLALLEMGAREELFQGLSGSQQIWMSHRDTVAEAPPGFRVTGHTGTCAVAAMSDGSRRLYGVQFHPEVVHTSRGTEILSNFLFRISECERDWNPKHRLPLIEDRIREVVGGRNVFFFVSGGVDSTVAFTLCVRALGHERARGIYVDTGLMREGETEFVRSVFEKLDSGAFEVCTAQEQFLSALQGVHDPEQKRQIIGEEFVRIQDRIIDAHHFLDEHWILGQGTIYPDTIESGGTEKAAVIKTHHNRVPGIRRLLEANRIVEPLSFFYKDEVREVGRELGLPEEMLERHPFPGPGLAIRCLCSETEAPVREVEDGWIVPVRSVGVQGDSRSYAPVLALHRSPSSREDLHTIATEMINRLPGVNRIVAYVAGHSPLTRLRVTASWLSPERLARLRRVDEIVRRLSHDSGFDRTVWQFPVILIPAGADGRPDSVVLRPVHSVDGMTARSVAMDPVLLETIATRLLDVAGVCAVFFDLTHKPPATIEWE
jgi:GMP synthase (glutamine-hydrolysing)